MNFFWSSEGLVETANNNTSNISFFTIPLIATYKFQKIIPGLTVSAGPQIALFSYRKWKQNGDVLATQWAMPDFAVYGFASLGYEHQLNDQWIIGAETFLNVVPRHAYNL